MIKKQLSAELLEKLLKKAEREHAKYEKKIGKKDKNWAKWYADFIIKELERN